jgi:hypothetical protein
LRKILGFISQAGDDGGLCETELTNREIEAQTSEETFRKGLNDIACDLRKKGELRTRYYV